MYTHLLIKILSSQFTKTSKLNYFQKNSGAKKIQPFSERRSVQNPKPPPYMNSEANEEKN